MERLLGTLSTWAPEECSGGLRLELGIESSSDPRHYYNDATVYNSYPFRSWDNLDETVNMRTFHMWHLFRGVGYNHAGHLRFLGDVTSTPGFQEARRYLGSLLQFQGLKKRRLPRVEIINSLLIRHQFKRQMSPLALAKLVHESLVNIASFRLERWCRTTNEEEEEYLKGMRETNLMKEALTNPRAIRLSRTSTFIFVKKHHKFSLLCGTLQSFQLVNSVRNQAIICHGSIMRSRAPTYGNFSGYALRHRRLVCRNAKHCSPCFAPAAIAAAMAQA